MTTIEQAAFNKVLERIKSDFLSAGLPNYMWEGMKLYLLHGISPGGFMTAVLCNNLSGAADRADDTNKHLLFDYCQFLHNGVPGSCHGSPERFNAWCEKGGFMGGAGQ